MTDAQRSRKLRASLKGSLKLASELLSLGTLTPSIRLTWGANVCSLLPGLIEDASKAVVSIEDAAAARAARKEGV